MGWVLWKVKENSGDGTLPKGAGSWDLPALSPYMICCFQPSCLQSSLPPEKDSGSFLKEKLLDPSVPGASCLNFGRCRPPWEGLLKQKPCAGEMTLMVLAFTFGPFSSQLSHESMEKFSTVGTWDQICLLAKWCWCCPRSPGRSQIPTRSW